VSFKIGDTVRVAKSMMTDYIGIEGIIVSIRRDDDPIFTVYTITTNDGSKMDFLEYQLELVTPSGGPAGASD